MTALTKPESGELGNRNRWMRIKDLYKGQRAFLIGNGPSLNRTPLHLLNDEFTMCFNRFDLMFDRLGWRPTMYMCIDNRVAENTAPKINEIVPLTRFAFFPDIHPRGGDFREFIKDSNNIFWLSLESVSSPGSYETLPTCSTIGTVAHLGLQVLVFMGFSPIYLVGIDLDYKEHKTVVKDTKADWTATKDDDPSHFDPRYFGAGAKYHEPSPFKVLVSGFENDKEILDKKGIRVMNAGIGGLVETFPRVDFRSLFNYEDAVELEMLLSAIPPALRRDAREALKGDKVITVHDDWNEKRPFTVTSTHLGEQLIPEVIMTHTPYGPFRKRHLFIRRDAAPNATAMGIENRNIDDNLKQSCHDSHQTPVYSTLAESLTDTMEVNLVKGEKAEKKDTVLTPKLNPYRKARHIDHDDMMQKFDKTIAVYDPSFREIGHNQYFNMHTLKTLSKLFNLVQYFETGGVLRDNYKSKPDNVEIIQIDMENGIRDNTDLLITKSKNEGKSNEEIKNVVNAYENKTYKYVWESIESYDPDLLVITSEGFIGTPLANAFYNTPPSIPFVIIVHILWQFTRRTNSEIFMEGLNKAEAIFAFEDYLVEKLRHLKEDSFRFPYKIFEAKTHWPVKKKTENHLKIGTIGIINERRNVDFIIESISQYQGPCFEYRLCGKPLGQAGEKIKKLAKNVSNKDKVNYIFKFEYLSEEEFNLQLYHVDFLLVAYDEARILQAPGIVYQAARCGTPLIAPKIKPFTLIEEKYPGIFIFYENLSFESLNNVLSALSKKDDFYVNSKERSLSAMSKFISDNSAVRQYDYLQTIFKKIIDNIDKKITCTNNAMAVVDHFIRSLCNKDNRFKTIFNDKVKEQIFHSKAIIDKTTNDAGIKEVSGNSNMLSEIMDSDFLKAICSDKVLLPKLYSINILDCIRNDIDVLDEYCCQNTKDFIFGKNFRYNLISRSSKYYGFWGKLIGAYKIHKVFNEWETTDKPKLAALKNKHSGKRAFVICNGPSLNKIDFSFLEDEITIGTNGFYLNYENSKFLPTYYIVEDELVGEDRQDDLNNLSGPTKFFAMRLAYCLNRGNDVIYLKHNISHYYPWRSEHTNAGIKMRFSPDLSVASYGGHTVTYACLQLAFHLGIQTVYIIGADHNYVVPDAYTGKDINENFIIESKEDDANHFNKDYFGKGFRWHNPKVHKLEEAYINAKKFYEYHGRKIYNATIGGHLEVFERVNFPGLFDEKHFNKHIPYSSTGPNFPLQSDVIYKSIQPPERGNYGLKTRKSSTKSLFLVGNGPSLRNMDFQKLQNVNWIGMNAAYRFWEKINVYPDYYICMDTVVGVSHRENILDLIKNREQLGIKMFFLRNNLLDFNPEISIIPEVIFLEDYLNSPYFDGIKKGVTTGSFAALFGAMLGYKLIYLLGIDLHYVQQIPEAKNAGGFVLEINDTPKSNPNYFFDDYQQKGDRYNLPYSSTPDLHYKSWAIVKARLIELGVHVFNCNPKSEVDLFNYAVINNIMQ